MAYKSSTQPFCRCCGNPIPKVTERIETGRAHDPKHTTGRLMLYSKAECQRQTNLTVVSVRFWRPNIFEHMSDDERAEAKKARPYVMHFDVWDGESYRDQHFCKGGCADTFGRMAARMTDIRTRAYNDAVKRHSERRANPSRTKR